MGPQHEIMVVSEEGIVIRMKSGDVSRLGRSTQGVKVMNVADNDRVTAVARMSVKPKQAKKADTNQTAFNLMEMEASSEDESVDIGGDEQVLDLDSDDE